MKMQRKQFRIGELAKKLEVERFVIRFWEKEFNIRGIRSTGGQRFYEEKDFDTFVLIKDLLYNKGFTISGAKKQLASQTQPRTVIASKRTSLDESQELEKLRKELSLIKKKLTKLQHLI